MSEPSSDPKVNEILFKLRSKECWEDMVTAKKYFIDQETGVQKLVDDNCDFLIHFHEGVSGNLGFKERQALAEKDHTFLATWQMSDQSL